MWLGIQIMASVKCKAMVRTGVWLCLVLCLIVLGLWLR